MRQERPLLRVAHQGSEIDITPGQPWYVGIGAACNLRLPVRGPAESWFVIRHAGVWTVRAVDGQTSMWLNGVSIPSDRSVRIGTTPFQELRARRGAADVTLAITVPGAGIPPAQAYGISPPEPEPEPLAEPSAEPSAEPEPPASAPDPAPVLRQVEAPEPPEQMSWATGELPAAAPPGLTERAGSPPSTDSGRFLRPERPPAIPTRITGVDQFLIVMKNRKWPGFISLSGSAGRGMVLGRSITAGSRSAVITPGPDGQPPATAAGRTIYELICPSGGRFPAGYLRDEGLVITTQGRILGWSLVLQRDASVIDAVPAPLVQPLARDFQLREIDDAELLPLLAAALERYLPA